MQESGFFSELNHLLGLASSRKSRIRCMGGLKTKTSRKSILALIVASLLLSSFAAEPIRADSVEARKYLGVKAGIGAFYSTGVDYRFDENSYANCSPYDVGHPFFNNDGRTKLLNECLEDPSLDLMIRNTLSPCSADITVPCIEEVLARNPNTDWIRGYFSGYFDDYRQASFGAIPQFETSEQHDRNLYTFPGLANDLNQLFVVQPLRKIYFNRGIYDVESMDVSLHAVRKTADKHDQKQRFNFTGSSEEYGKEILSCTYPNHYDVDCWDYEDNSLSNQFKVVLRLPRLPFGWVTGRLYSPDIKFELIRGGVAQPYRVTLTGSPVPTPVIDKRYFLDEPESVGICAAFSHELRLQSRFGCNVETQILPMQITQYENLKNKIPELDFATRIVDDWQVSLTYPKNVKKDVVGKGCQANTQIFKGFVGSNALTYDQYPKFDMALNSLDYMVGGPHYMPDKSVFSGLYSMMITREYAKCIWGLSSPVFNASVQVVDQDGVVSTAVTTIGIDDQFVRFSATGFTFSKKIMRVKFFKTKKELDQSKKWNITCVKNGKVSRFVGVPSCPKGFKVKK